MTITNLSGRLVVTNGIDANPHKKPALVKINQQQFKCQRCQTINQISTCQINTVTFYCPECIMLGRLTNHDYLLAFPETNSFPTISNPLTWQGTLTPAQQQIAHKLCQIADQQATHLVWAVTGSGKTEMLFPVISREIKKRHRIALVAPRVDVCNELYPRLQQAFSNVGIQLLHGQGANEYQYTQIVICTVHQLLKFRAAFDVLILDECDSYPYVNNDLLHRAVEQSLKIKHTLIYLSATPSFEYQKLIKQKRMNYSLLNRRFHGKDLPIPKFYRVKPTKNLAPKLLRHLELLVQQKQRFLLFVDSINQSENLSKLLSKEISSLDQTFVHAKDVNRQQKVADFRQGKRQALITTTVLERGVTFPNVDVIVWQANSTRFNEQTLMQIAGRAGRSAQHADNKVTFYGSDYTLAISHAIQKIKRLNHA